MLSDFQTLSARVLDAIDTGVVVVDAQGVIVHCNAGAVEILERQRDAICGSHISVVLAPVAQLIDRMAGQSRGEYDTTLPSGATITLGYHTADMKDGHTAIVFQNISQWVTLRRERDRLLRLATVGEFMPTLLHEFKNPLASISTAIEVMIEEHPGGQLEEELRAILGEIHRMRLGFDGIGAVGRSLRSTRDAPIATACQEASRVLKARADRAGVQLRCDVPNMRPLPFDPAVVRAIVFNLVVNAIDACRPGDAIHLGASLEENDSIFEIRVSDSGRGMTPEERDHCTELFFTTKPRGTGIGLALCARAVEEAGGKMRVESELGMGTTICLRVPIASDRL